MKVLLWDYTRGGGQWFSQFGLEGTEVVGSVTADDSEQDKIIRESSWDYLLIFENGLRNMFDAMIRTMGLSRERVIYALDLSDWLRHPLAVLLLLKDGSIMHRYLENGTERRRKDFISCTVDGLSFLGSSEDGVLAPFMYIYQTTYSREEMSLFHALSREFYGVGDEPGWFFDLGANIGTTCVYFKKKLDPFVKILAFEPDPLNNKLLRANLIINDITDSVTEELALGDAAGEATLHRCGGNHGGNSLIKDYGGGDVHVRVTSLDDYMRENQIMARDVKYIWIDTEGFEAKLIAGAESLLSSRPIPLYTELNPSAWQASGAYDRMMEILSINYAGYIHIPRGLHIEKKIHPLDSLRKYQEQEMGGIGGLGDIFLVKK